VLRSAMPIFLAAHSPCFFWHFSHSPHIDMCLTGVDIIANGSGSHHQLRKLNARVDLILNATKRGGGAYLFSNHKGGDGGRLYYDGCALVCVNGSVVAQGAQFGLEDVEVVTATVDLQDIRSYRQGCKSRQEQGSQVKPLPEVLIPPSEGFSLLIGKGLGDTSHTVLCRCAMCRVTPPLPGGVRYHSPEEECALGPACWLWDFLRRSNAAGASLHSQQIPCSLCVELTNG
jgi:NAD+ synthase (glutamine-hydrolysing)